MIVLPSIDIKDGLCVRLYQGDYAQVTTYDADPVRVVRRWQEAGASWLHVVDLDGAREGAPVNLALIERIRAATHMQIEIGGGLRSLAHIEQMLNLGVERVVLGTIALTDKVLLQEALARWRKQIVVGIDARNGVVATSGWLETSRVDATELASELTDLGVQRFSYTDIERDGTLNGPNLSALARMQRATPRPLIASGGVSSLADLRALSELGVEGAIIGKALYNGAIDLAVALREIEGV